MNEETPGPLEAVAPRTNSLQLQWTPVTNLLISLVTVLYPGNVALRAQDLIFVLRL